MKSDIAVIKTVLITTPDRWIALVHSLPEELLNLPPAPGEWSAVECLQHIIDVEQVFQFRLRAFLDGLESFPSFDPDAEGSQLRSTPSARDLAAEFAGLREASLQSIQKIKPGDLDRQALHAELGQVTLREMLNEWPAHDLNHTVQAERALMQPFIQGCGPWQQYFLDHFVRQDGG